MDVSALRGRIIATINSDQSIRMQAELDLKTVSLTTSISRSWDTYAWPPPQVQVLTAPAG
jgi:hypothetical protein